MREARVTVEDSEFEAMGIETLVSLSREAGLREFEELACRGTGAIGQVTVETRIDEERLSSLDCVDHWERVTESSDAERYVVEFTAPELPDSFGDAMEELVGPCDPELNERGASLSLVGPQEAISRALGEYDAAGVSPDLRKLGPYEGRTRPIDELTDRQREVIRTAYDEGYYEVPRETTTDAIAAELDVDASTVVEHLQRAEQNLLGQHL